MPFKDSHMVVLLCMQQETANEMDTDGGILHHRMSNAGVLYSHVYI